MRAIRCFDASAMRLQYLQQKVTGIWLVLHEKHLGVSEINMLLRNGGAASDSCSHTFQKEEDAPRT